MLSSHQERTPLNHRHPLTLAVTQRSSDLTKTSATAMSGPPLRLTLQAALLETGWRHPFITADVLGERLLLGMDLGYK